MWLVYPVTADDLRTARRGILALLAGSAVWYVTFATVLAVWSDVVLDKVRRKFVRMEYVETYWPPFLVLLAGFVAAGLLRLIGYRLCRNAAGAVGAADGLLVAMLGALVSVGTVGSLYFGFSGFIALVAAFGTALELKFVRFPAQLFGMVVSPAAVRRVGWLFYARTVWLVAVAVAGLILLAAHILVDLPRPDDGPTDRTVRSLNATLRLAFNALSGFAVVGLPLITAGYWGMLAAVYGSIDRLADPNGPAVMPVAPDRPGYDLLKQVLQKQEW